MFFVLIKSVIGNERIEPYLPLIFMIRAGINVMSENHIRGPGQDRINNLCDVMKEKELFKVLLFKTLQSKRKDKEENTFRNIEQDIGNIILEIGYPGYVRILKAF